MNADHWILLGYWCLFSLLHSGMASEKFKEFCHSAMGAGFKYYRLIYSTIAFISLGIVMVWQFSIPSPIIRISPLIVYLAGFPAGVLGSILMGVSIRNYFFNLSGISVLFHKSTPAVLKLDGLNKYMRHPLYLGTLLLIWSLFLFFPFLSNLLACASLTVYVFIGIRLEEQKLLHLFGDAYASYRRKTPMLIPDFQV
jgi:protein-S-isoprenylcysteine O-methyltransferase Ste14